MTTATERRAALDAAREAYRKAGVEIEIARSREERANGSALRAARAEGRAAEAAQAAAMAAIADAKTAIAEAGDQE